MHCEARVQATGAPGVYYLATVGYTVATAACGWRRSDHSCLWPAGSSGRKPLATTQSRKQALVTAQSRKEAFGETDNTVLQDREMEEEVPYYKDYAVGDSLQIVWGCSTKILLRLSTNRLKTKQSFFQANATRGVIAALVVVAIFLGYAILDR